MINVSLWPNAGWRVHPPLKISSMFGERSTKCVPISICLRELNTFQMSTQALVVSLFSSLLSLFSCHLPDHSYGVPIIKTVLSPQWLRKLNSYTSGSHNEQILASLKLFDAISIFGSGRERKSVFESFPWDNKVRSSYFLHSETHCSIESTEITLHA